MKKATLAPAQKTPVKEPVFDDIMFPRGISARITPTGLLTTMFDCSCDNHHCLTTKFSLALLKALDMVSAKFDQPITIVTAYNCQEPSFAQGKALRLQSSANDQLLSIWERLYPEFSPHTDGDFVLLQLGRK